MRVTAEFLPLIHTINMYISVSNSKDISHIEMEEDAIVLRKECNSRPTKIKLGKGIVFQPNSLSGISYESNWLSFRLQLKPKSNIISCVLGQLIKEIPSLNLNCNNENDLVSKLVQLQCKCGFLLSEKMTLKKVCELPSQELLSASENWFCHVHEDWKRSTQDYRLMPRQNECFYDEVSFFLSTSFLTLKACDDVLICKGCLQNIGLKVGEAFKIWKSEIHWISVDKVVFRKSASEIFLSLLCILEKHNLGTMPHIVLETHKEEFLYIIVIDSHLNLLIMDNSILNDSSPFSEFLPPRKQQRMAEDTIISLKKVPCVKVLYKHKTVQDKETKQWRNDANIYNLFCNPSLFNSVLQLLINSTNCVPENLRNVNGFDIGYVVKNFKNELHPEKS